MIIVTAAFPFVPAELNIAHFASTYVPADVYCRLLNRTGNQAVLLSATDYHSIYASDGGKIPDMAMCEKYHQKYLSQFDLLNISFDKYIVTEDPQHKKYVQSCYRLLNRSDRIAEKDTVDIVCEECGCHLPSRLTGNGFVDNSHCYFCGSENLINRSVKHFFLKLEGAREIFYRFTERQPQKQVRNMLSEFIAKPIEDWDITRTNHIGVAHPDHSDLSFYIWFDSLIAYYSLEKDYCSFSEKTVRFIGKNIVYYHGVVLTAMNQFLDKKPLDSIISARGFLDFNKTDKSMTASDLMTEKYHSDFIRFYLLFKVKDDISDYYFTETDFCRTVTYYCCKRIGGFFYRAWYYLTQSPFSHSRSAQSSEQFRNAENTFLGEFVEAMDKVYLQKALKLILQYLGLVNTAVADGIKSKDYSAGMTDYIKRSCSLLVCLLSAIMPETAEKYSVFQGWVPKNIAEACSEYLNHHIKKNKEKIIFSINDNE